MEILATRCVRLGGCSWPIVLAVLAGAAAAQDLPLSENAAIMTGRANQPSRLELSASSVPNFDGGDATRTNRVDMIWLPPRRPVGLALGLSSNEGMGFRPLGAPGAPAVDVGVHWRYDDLYRIDVTAWRRMTAPDAPGLSPDRQSNYGARLEMQMNKSAARSFRIDHGFLGLQLEGGARIGVRRSGGHPMFYYRTSF